MRAFEPEACRMVDYPGIIQMVAQQRVKLTPVITHRFPLDAINEALDVLRGGEALPTIITF